MKLEKFSFGMGDRFLHQGAGTIYRHIVEQRGADFIAEVSMDETANGWSGEEYARALRHNQADPLYNLHLRQLLHVGYKVAAQMGERYYSALKEFESDVARNVTENLWERHIKILFMD